ncbi:MAG: recombinase family protein [Defluviitaleaceae bacterium]|nr:recombinase family protein [Defluviitaleaceae bacterium]
MNAQYGYVRVSTNEQNEERQVTAMRTFGVATDAIFSEKMSGKNFNRPIYKSLMKKLKRGDTLVIKSIDRLGRDYGEILEQWQFITKKKKAFIVVLDMPLLDTREKERDLTGAFVSDLVLQILSYVAEQERVFLRQRQEEGIAAAKEKGVQFGRPKKESQSDFYEIVEKWEQKKLTLQDALDISGLSQATFYRRLQSLSRE